MYIDPSAVLVHIMRDYAMYLKHRQPRWGRDYLVRYFQRVFPCVCGIAVLHRNPCRDFVGVIL